MLGRVPIRDVQSLDEVMTFVESGDGGQVIISDIDNTLAPQGCDLGEFAEIVNAAIDRCEACSHVGRFIALTNGSQRHVDRMVSRGNKPWTSRRRLGLHKDDSIVVVGDQVLTDGLLAWRLRATFLHLVIDDEEEERRQAVMRRIGAMITAILFRPAPTPA